MASGVGFGQTDPLRSDTVNSQIHCGRYSSKADFTEISGSLISEKKWI